MRWFKHLVGSGDDPDVIDAMILFGKDGYYIFFRTLEILSREFNEKNPGTSTFTLEYFLSRFYKTSWKTLSSVLQFFQDRERFHIQFSENQKFKQITIKCMKLKDLCDEYTRKLLWQKSGQTPDNVRIISPKEVEVDKEEEKKKKKEEVSTPIFYECEFFQITQTYHKELVKEFPLVDLSDLYVRLKNYCVDNPLRYKRNVHGHIKNLRNILRNWCIRARPIQSQPSPKPLTPINNLSPLPDESERLQNGKTKIRGLINGVLTKDKRILPPTDTTERRRVLEEQKKELGVE